MFFPLTPLQHMREGCSIKQTSEPLPKSPGSKKRVKLGEGRNWTWKGGKNGRQRENNPGSCYCRATVIMIPAAPVDFPIRFATGQKPQSNTHMHLSLFCHVILLRDILCEGFKVGLQWVFLYISTNLNENRFLMNGSINVNAESFITHNQHVFLLRKVKH